MPITDARHYKTLLICPHRQISAEIGPLVAAALPLAPVHEVKEYPQRKQLVQVLKGFDAKLCLIDFATDPDQAFHVVAELSSLDPNIPVVALLAGNNPDLILRCLRQGATEFLIRPFTADQAEASFEKIARLHPPPSSRRLSGARVIAVVPSKGACGATTISCNLAHQAKKMCSGKTLLADLDPVTGTVSFLLKLKSTYSFLDVLSRGESIDADVWKQVVTTTQGLDVLLPPEHLMEALDELPEATQIVTSGQQIYEAMIIDCGSAWGRWNVSIAAAADEVLLITTNELSTLHAAQRVLHYWEMMRIDTAKVKLVVNRYHRQFGIHSDSISSVLEADMLHLIPSDYDTLQRCTMEGKLAPAGSTFGKSIATLADTVIAAGRSGSEKSSGRGLRGMFSRN
jgi:pilus assembly protein CpaE